MLPEDHPKKIAELKALIEERGGVRVDELCDWFCWGPPEPEADEQGYEIYCLANTQLRNLFDQAMFLELIEPKKNEGKVAELEEACSELPQDLVLYLKERSQKLTLFRDIGKIAYERADGEEKSGMKDFSPNHADALVVKAVREEDTKTLGEVTALIKEFIRDYRISKDDVPATYRDTPSRVGGKTPQVSRTFIELGRSTMACLSSILFKVPDDFRQDIQSAYIDVKGRADR